MRKERIKMVRLAVKQTAVEWNVEMIKNYTMQKVIRDLQFKMVNGALRDLIGKPVKQ